MLLTYMPQHNLLQTTGPPHITSNTIHPKAIHNPYHSTQKTILVWTKPELGYFWFVCLVVRELIASLQTYALNSYFLWNNLVCFSINPSTQIVAAKNDTAHYKLFIYFFVTCKCGGSSHCAAVVLPLFW